MKSQNSARKGTWSFATTEGGTGIECSACHHKIKAMTVVMGDVNLNKCKFCSADMEPISQMLLNRMHDEVQTRWS